MLELLSGALVRALDLEITVTAALPSVCPHDGETCMHEALFALPFSALMAQHASALLTWKAGILL